MTWENIVTHCLQALLLFVSTLAMRQLYFRSTLTRDFVARQQALAENDNLSSFRWFISTLLSCPACLTYWMALICGSLIWGFSNLTGAKLCSILATGWLLEWIPVCAEQGVRSLAMWFAQLDEASWLPTPPKRPAAPVSATDDADDDDAVDEAREEALDFATAAAADEDDADDESLVMPPPGYVMPAPSGPVGTSDELAYGTEQFGLRPNLDIAVDSDPHNA